LISSLAGSTIAQTRGTDVERSAQHARSQAGAIEADRQAESAAGIGRTDGEEHGASDRDADGRRAWELPLPQAAEPLPASEAPGGQARDASGQSGNALDLCG